MFKISEEADNADFVNNEEIINFLFCTLNADTNLKNELAEEAIEYTCDLCHMPSNAVIRDIWFHLIEMKLWNISDALLIPKKLKKKKICLQAAVEM